MIAMPDIRLFPSPALSFKVAPPPKKWQLWIWGRGTGGISWKGNYVGEGEVRWLSWCLNETAAGKYISNFQYWIYTKNEESSPCKDFKESGERWLGGCTMTFLFEWKPAESTGYKFRTLIFDIRNKTSLELHGESWKSPSCKYLILEDVQMVLDVGCREQSSIISFNAASRS